MIAVSLDEVLNSVDTIRQHALSGKALGKAGAKQDKQEAGVCCLLRIHPIELENPRIDLESKQSNFGRDASADVLLDDCSVSRRHAVIDRIGDVYMLTDLGSTNGTYVNGKRIESQPLESGDRVRMGDQIFKFMEADGVEAQYHALMLDSVSRDGLTGAYNKRYFSELLERRVSSSRRHDKSVSLIMLDVDHFKSVNDVHGHLAGDEVLKELVRRLTETLRLEDVLARYGGEEFAILIDEQTVPELVAERCRIVVESAPFETNAGQFDITISVGVAAMAGDYEPAELVAATDAELYRAKHEGRNRVCVQGR